MIKVALLSLTLLLAACGHKDYKYEVRVGTSDRHDSLFTNTRPYVSNGQVCVVDAYVRLLINNSFKAKAYCTDNANGQYQIQVIEK